MEGSKEGGMEGREEGIVIFWGRGLQYWGLNSGPLAC
jgi:hypothetical protein